MKVFILLLSVSTVFFAQLANSYVSQLTETVLDEDGRILYLTDQGAFRYCREYGGHLPTVREWSQHATNSGAVGIIEADRYLGEQGYYLVNSAGDKFYYNPTGFRNWEIEKLTFWTASSTYLEKNGGYIFLHAFVFEGSHGFIMSNQFGSDMHSVRCAIDTTSQQIRKSILGYDFVRDRLVPSLEGAYRDPSGLIWGSALDCRTSSTPCFKHMTPGEADQYCRKMGTRLPTRIEFQKLATYLGKGSTENYSGLTKDKTDEMIDGLSDNDGWFISSEKNYFIFDGSTGEFDVGDSQRRYLVMCVH